MSDDLGRDIVDGSIINWSKLSKEELENIIDVYKQKEKRDGSSGKRCLSDSNNNQ